MIVFGYFVTKKTIKIINSNLMEIKGAFLVFMESL
jgi:hypothetical protein